jgi:hypothetical protein
MLRNAENFLYREIGKFATVHLPNDRTNQYLSFLEVSQCTAFLCSNREFVWFIESWDVNRNDDNLVLENKKIYPAKVVGLNLASPLPIDSLDPLNESVYWREGLIGTDAQQSNNGYRPGFGEHIFSDLDRPLLNQSIPRTDLLGTGFNPVYTSSYKIAFSRQLGRLMSMAFYVDPTLAAKYDASKSKKRKNR